MILSPRLYIPDSPIKTIKIGLSIILNYPEAQVIVSNENIVNTFGFNIIEPTIIWLNLYIINCLYLFHCLNILNQIIKMQETCPTFHPWIGFWKIHMKWWWKCSKCMNYGNLMNKFTNIVYAHFFISAVLFD